MSKINALEIQASLPDTNEPGYDMPVARRLAQELCGVAINGRFREEKGRWEIGGWAQPTDRHIVVVPTGNKRTPYAIIADNLGLILHADDYAAV